MHVARMPPRRDHGSGQDRSHARAYDRSYFDKWYRSPTHRVRTAAELTRLVTFVLATADYVLGRRVRTVLDVGAGEGNWLPVLRRLRPSVVYQGVDPSAYAVHRFGRRRNLLLGDLASLDALPLSDSYDLVVANGMLNYVSADELRAGLPKLAARAGGMLYLEMFTAADDIKGDTAFPEFRDAAWYRRALRAAGLTGCGLHCYLPRHEAWRLAELERSL
jgi:SAM-dependent methyltransferase